MHALLGGFSSFSSCSAGLAGTIVPLLPDTPLIVAAAVLHHFIFGAHGASWTTILVLTS